MTHVERTLDPEIAGLVREVMQDPNSILLRVTPAQRRAAIYDHDPRPGAIRDQLSTRERKIYDSYREDVALYLLRAAARAIKDDPEAKDRVFFHTSANALWTPPSVGLLEESRGRLLREGDENMHSAGCHAQLRRGIETTSARRRTAADLAGAALRLAPSSEARIYHGLGLLHQERALAPARSSFQRVVQDVGTGINASHAWAGSAFALLNSDRLRALEAYQRAVEAGSDVHHVGYRFAVALSVGDRASVERAAADVESRFDETCPAAKELLVAMNQLRKAPAHAWIQLDALTVRSLTNRLGPIAKRLANEFIL